MVKQELSIFLDEAIKRKESYRIRHEGELEEQHERLDRVRRKFFQMQEGAGDEQKRAREFDALWHLARVRRVKVNSDRIVVYTDPIYITSWGMRFRLGRYKITIYKNGDVKIHAISWSLRSLFPGDHPHIRYGKPCFGNASGYIRGLIREKEHVVAIAEIIAFLEKGYNRSDEGRIPIGTWWVPWRPIGWASSLVVSPIINFFVKKIFMTKSMKEKNKVEYLERFLRLGSENVEEILTREFENIDLAFRQFVWSYRGKRKVEPSDIDAVYNGLKKLEEAGWKINISSQLDATTPPLEIEENNEKRPIGRFRIVFDGDDDLRVVPIDGQSHLYIFNNQLFIRKDVYLSVAKLISANRYDQALQLIKDYLCYYDADQSFYPIKK